MVSRDESRNRMFPVGLYGALLVGLFGVTFPELIAPVEAAARAVVCLPLRAYSILANAQPVLAAERTPPPMALFDGQTRSQLRGATGPAGHTPRVCRVLDRRVGPLGLVDELILDATRRELVGCAPLVTAGPGLLGFLAPFDDDLAQQRDPARKQDPDEQRDGVGSEPARVRLLHYRRRHGEDALRALAPREPFRSARVAARVQVEELGARGELQFLVEPARAVDRWPLRCALLSDSYLGSQMRTSGAMVTTIADPERFLPEGLRVGHLMIWGYPQLDIPIGLFVEPVRDPRSISSVVVWESADGSSAAPPPPAGELLPVRFTRFPAPRPVGERWMVTASAATPLRNRAALVDRGRLLGLLRDPWSGQSLVTPFAVSGRDWALLLRTLDGGVHELTGRVVGPPDGGLLRIRVLAGAADPALASWRFRAELYTGANGPDCPAGLRIGGVQSVPASVLSGGARELLLRLTDDPVVAPEVFVGPEVRAP